MLVKTILQTSNGSIQTLEIDTSVVGLWIRKAKVHTCSLQIHPQNALAVSFEDPPHPTASVCTLLGTRISQIVHLPSSSAEQ